MRAGILYLFFLFAQVCLADPVIWSDDFNSEQPIDKRYFEFDSAAGSFGYHATAGRKNSGAMCATWKEGQVEAGSLKLFLGRNPAGASVHSDRDFHELYWRIFVRMDAPWEGTPDKFMRAIVFAEKNWSQAAIGHVWGENGRLMLDPVRLVSPTDGRLRSSKYNDFSAMTWLGKTKGYTEVFDSDNAGKWTCVEMRMQLNDPEAPNGEFSLWIDDAIDAQAIRLDFVGSWKDYGINGIFLENYWNKGAPKQQTRCFDDFVVSTERIGCD